MTSTEGLFIRHSDQQPGFLQVRILIKLSKIQEKEHPREHPILLHTGTGAVLYSTIWTDCTSLNQW